MLRKGMLQLPPSCDVSQLLPDKKAWQEMMAELHSRGYAMQKLHSYAQILAAPSNAERIQLFLANNEFRPMFIFGFLLRCGVDKVEHLEELGFYCRRWYSRRRDGPRSWQHSVPLLTVDFKDLGHPLRLLLENCYRLDPRLLPQVAETASIMLITLSEHDDQNDQVRLQQSRVFNQVISLFPQSNYGIYPQRELPSAYTWAALEILLYTSASLTRPCLTSLEGFRAIKEVMASQTRDQKDLRIVPRLSESWPPYLVPSDGMDEVAEPHENWSRTVLASAFMQENGYSKEEADLALDTLQGMAPNGSPTIHQNETVARSSDMRVWAASIMATRNSIEAWQMFQQCPGDPEAKPTIEEYTAMFEKLVYRYVGPSAKAMPGDRNVNFPSTSYNSFTELERLRLQPPTVEELYDRMRSDKISPNATCLRLLIGNAQSMDEISTYIRDSRLPEPIKDVFLMWEAWDTKLFQGNRASEIAINFFPAVAKALIRIKMPTAVGIRDLIEKGVGVLQAAGPDGPKRMVGFWKTALGALAQNNFRPGDDSQQQLAAILHSGRLIEQAGQMSVPVLVRFSDALRRFAASFFRQLDAKGPPLPDSFLDLYDPQVQKTQWTTTIDQQASKSAAAIDDALSKGVGSGLALATSTLREYVANLVQHEQRTQSLLADNPVPPIVRMRNRQDPVQARHVYSLVWTFAHLGDFEEAAKVLKWSVTQWMEADVVDALRYLDDDAGFHHTLCLFREMVEPMLPANTVRDLQILITSENSPFRWPNADEVDAFFKNMRPQNLTLATIIDHIQRRHSQRGEQERTGVSAEQEQQ
jgi:hypothetical protein